MEGSSPPFLIKKNISMTKFICPCKYKYDPEKGDPKGGIPAGTKFEDLPDTWRCPRCKRKKEKFVAIEE
jgi:rubredoxin